MLCTASLLALLSASCCVLPIGLSIIGLGGAWLGFLGVFVANRTFILVVVGLVVVSAWLRLARSPSCRRRTGAIALAGMATLALLVAASAPLWEANAQRALWTLWLESGS